MLTLKDVYDKHNNNNYYEVPFEYPKEQVYKEDHVFNLNKSPEWNKKEVQRQNTVLQARRDNWLNTNKELYSYFKEDIIEAIQNEYPFFNHYQAQKVFEYIISKDLLSIDIIIEEIQNICYMITNIIEEEKGKC